MRRVRSGESKPSLRGGIFTSARAWPTASAYDWRRGDGVDWGTAMVGIMGVVVVFLSGFLCLVFWRGNDKYWWFIILVIPILNSLG